MKEQSIPEIYVDEATLNRTYPEVEYPNNYLQADNNINLVIIGHVDSGKSTLTGHLLFKLGEISKEVIRKNVKKTEEFKKAGFEFAYIMDDTEEE